MVYEYCEVIFGWVFIYGYVYVGDDGGKYKVFGDYYEDGYDVFIDSGWNDVIVVYCCECLYWLK